MSTDPSIRLSSISIMRKQRLIRVGPGDVREAAELPSLRGSAGFCILQVCVTLCNVALFKALTACQRLGKRKGATKKGP
jgi:hypothetical protein